MESSTKNFSAVELRCHCPKCNKQQPNKVQQSSADKLQLLREKVNRPLSIVSAYRCAEHPVEKRKTTPGQHNKGTAFDIAVGDGSEAYEVMKHAFELGFTGIARGNGFVHIDTRTSTPVNWIY